VGRGVLKLVEFDRKGFQERLARMTLTSGQLYVTVAICV
jgi:hypothetical protein